MMMVIAPDVLPKMVVTVALRGVSIPVVLVPISVSSIINLSVLPRLCQDRWVLLQPSRNARMTIQVRRGIIRQALIRPRMGLTGIAATGLLHQDLPPAQRPIR